MRRVTCRQPTHWNAVSQLFPHRIFQYTIQPAQLKVLRLSAKWAAFSESLEGLYYFRKKFRKNNSQERDPKVKMKTITFDLRTKNCSVLRSLLMHLTGQLIASATSPRLVTCLPTLLWNELGQSLVAKRGLSQSRSQEYGNTCGQSRAGDRYDQLAHKVHQIRDLSHTVEFLSSQLFSLNSFLKWIRSSVNVIILRSHKAIMRMHGAPIRTHKLSSETFSMHECQLNGNELRSKKTFWKCTLFLRGCKYSCAIPEVLQ